MTRALLPASEVTTMLRITPHPAIGRNGPGQKGQILVIAVVAMVAMVAGVALILDGGNAYAQQRVAQNGADAVANAGATVLGERLGGATKSDADVLSAMNLISTANALDGYSAYYTTWQGNLLTTGGVQTTDISSAAAVGPGDGDSSIPAGAQGVQVTANHTFDTTFARAIGFSQFTASADATAVTGAVTGGQFLPVVFPVNIVDCDTNGDLGIGETDWVLSQPPTTADGYPTGPEYIVPLCKTGGGSFMVLDLDGIKNNCPDEVTNPPAIQFTEFPTYKDSDNGNNCAKPMTPAVNALHGKVVLVPICDVNCETSGGSNAQYKIIKVAAFWVDYMSDDGAKNKNDPLCSTHIGASGQQLTTIRGNGSSSCIAGWFVRYITAAPVGPGTVTGAGAIGIQLVK